MKGGNRRLGALLLSAIIVSALLGSLASATVDWIRITAVNDIPVNKTYCEVSHRKDNITFTVHTIPGREDVCANVSGVYYLGKKTTNATGFATFKWDIPADIALGNYTVYGYNATNYSDVKNCTVNITNFAPVITAILVENATGWYDITRGGKVIAHAGDILNVSVNVTDDDGFEDIANVSVNMSIFNPEWITLPKRAKNDTNWALFNGSVKVKKAVSGSITVNVTDSRGAYNVTTTGGTLQIEAASPAKWNIDTPYGNSTVEDTLEIVINVTDEFGNINNTFAYWINGSITLTWIKGSGSISPDASVNLNGAMNKPCVNKTIIASERPAEVKVEVFGGGLTPDSETIKFCAAPTTIALTLDKPFLFANNSDTATLTAQLKDAEGEDVMAPGVDITISEYTTYGLRFDGKLRTTNTTDPNGRATFTVKAGRKAGDAKIIANIESGPYAGIKGEIDLLLKQAPDTGNTANTVYPATITAITAGENRTITLTLKDYNDTAIKNAVDFPIEFNITSGDAKWLESDGKVYQVTSDSNGNVSATLYSTNASAANRINVMISVKNETGGWETVKTISNINVVAGVPTKLEISPKKSVGLTNVKGTSQVFTLQLQDAYGNDNTSATSPVLITTDNEALGNMTCGTTTVNNNLWCNITANGNTTFTYTVNSTVPGTAKLTVNVTEFGIIDTITITTTGPTGLNLTVDKKLPLVGESVTATAQLTALVGGKETDIAINNITITFTLWDPDGNLVGYTTNNTDTTGAATYTFSKTTLGTYTIKAANATYEGVTDTNTTTYVGNATQIWIAVNNTNPQVNETISVYAIFKDKSGYNSSSVDGDKVSFIANGAEFTKETISNGVASATYTPTEQGIVTLYVFYTNATNPYWEGVTPSNSTDINVGPPEALTVTANVTSVVVGTPTAVLFNVTSDGEAVEGALVSVSQAGVELVNGTTDATGLVTLTVNATSEGIINVTASKTGYESGNTTINATQAVGVTVSGTVKGINQEAISGATVTINGYSATTDENGNYSISNVPTGTYNVTASATGYREETKADVSITTDTTIDFVGNDGLLKEPCSDTTYVLQVINTWAADEITDTTKVLTQINIWAVS